MIAFRIFALLPFFFDVIGKIVSYGGSVVIFWLVAGVLVSLVRDDVVAG